MFVKEDLYSKATSEPTLYVPFMDRIHDNANQLLLDVDGPKTRSLVVQCRRLVDNANNLKSSEGAELVHPILPTQDETVMTTEQFQSFIASFSQREDYNRIHTLDPMAIDMACIEDIVFKDFSSLHALDYDFVLAND